MTSSRKPRSERPWVVIEMPSIQTRDDARFTRTLGNGVLIAPGTKNSSSDCCYSVLKERSRYCRFTNWRNGALFTPMLIYRCFQMQWLGPPSPRPEVFTSIAQSKYAAIGNLIEWAHPVLLFFIPGMLYQSVPIPLVMEFRTCSLECRTLAQW